MKHRHHLSYATGIGHAFDRVDALVIGGLLTRKEASRVGDRLLRLAKSRGLTVQTVGLHTIAVSWTKLDGTKATRRYGWGR